MRQSILSHMFTLLAMTVGFTFTTARAVDFVTFTDQATFLAAVSGAVTDTYNDLPDLSSVNSPLNRTVSPYQYSATAANGFYTAGSAGDVWLSTNTAANPMDFTLTSGAPTAMGGYFFATNISGSLTTGTINVSINGGQFLQTISTSSATNFFGWVSPNDTPITDFQVSTTQPGTGVSYWPTANNLILAQAVPVPEPSTYALGGLAALTLSLVSRRRKRK